MLLYQENSSEIDHNFLKKYGFDAFVVLKLIESLEKINIFIYW